MFCLSRFNKLVFVSVIAALLITAGFSWQDCALSSDDNIVGVADDKIFITKPELDQAISEYKTAAKKTEITKEEKVGLVKNLIRRQLILQQESVAVYKKDPETIRKVTAYENSLIVSRFLQEVVGSKVDVSEEDMKAFYAKNRDKLTQSPAVEASQILLRSREDAEIVQKKLHDGANFEELAKQYSIDLPMAFEGGKMGTIEKGKTLPELDKELFLLAEGETSGIVETRFGFHILRVDKSIPAGIKPFEDVRNDIKQAVMREKENKAFEEMVRKLEQKSDIKIFEDRLDIIQQASGSTK
jgi:peptidyl-prolyl cis-trans isomerase C